MKKKILTYVMLTIIFSLVIVSSAYIVIANYNNLQNAKLTLNNYNTLLKTLVDDRSVDYANFPIVEGDVRMTIIDTDGKILFDNMKPIEELDNHGNRREVIEARENGEGVEVRFSQSVQSNMVYSAVRLTDGKIIRTSIPVETIAIMKNGDLKYYIIALIGVLIISLVLAMKLINAIIKPIKELEYISSRIAKGELHMRAENYSNDELGNLANSFNKMAEELQLTISGVKEEENRLKAIVTSMDSGVIALDKERRIVLMNPYAKEIFGVKEIAIGKNLVDVIRDFDLNQVFFDNKNLHEIKILHPVERELRVRSADVRNEVGIIGKVAVLQDLTDIRKLERMRSEFVANVSHELKTPVTSIKGFAETLKDVEDSETREKFLNIINEESERLTRLIDDILTLSNIESNAVEVQEEFDVNQEVDIAYNLLKNTAKEKNIELISENNVKCKLMGNRFRFRQMLINLTENAIKYTEAKGSVTIESYVEKDEYKLKVIDTGIGIPEEDISRIFERFYRVDKARSRKKGGTGLGLAIVKHIVKTFKGEILVESEEGVGTSITVSIKI